MQFHPSLYQLSDMIHVILPVGLFCSCVQKVPLHLKKPPYTTEQYLDILTCNGLVATAVELLCCTFAITCPRFADAFSLLAPLGKMPVTAIYLLCDLARISEDCLTGRLTGATLRLSAKTISVFSPPNHVWRFEIDSPGSTGTSQHVQDLEKLIPESLMRS